MRLYLLILFLAFSFAAENIRDPFSAAATTPVLSTHVYNLNNRDTDAVVTMLHRVYPDIYIASEKESKSILVRAPRDILKQITKHLKDIDTPEAQVHIDIQVIELSSNDIQELGLRWTSQGTLVVGSPEKPEVVIDRIGAALKAGTGSLLANPTLVTTVGKQASIHIGDRLPYTVANDNGTRVQWQVNYLDAGVNLTLTPTSAEPGYINILLEPEVSTITQWKQTLNGEYPVLSSRRLLSTLRLKEGEPCILGGLINQEERSTTHKLPFLGDIPLLGALFTYTTKEQIKSDILFIVTAQRR